MAWQTTEPSLTWSRSWLSGASRCCARRCCWPAARKPARTWCRPAGGRFTFWVNPVNYLPVRASLAQRQTDFHWLAATPARLAQLKVAVPAGFRQVRAPVAPAAQAR